MLRHSQNDLARWRVEDDPDEDDEATTFGSSLRSERKPLLASAHSAELDHQVSGRRWKGLFPLLGFTAAALVLVAAFGGLRVRGWRDVRVTVENGSSLLLPTPVHLEMDESPRAPPSLSFLRLSRVLHISPPSSTNAFKEMHLPNPSDTLTAQRSSGAKGHSYFHPVVTRTHTYAAPKLGEEMDFGVLEDRPILVPDMEDPLTVLSMAYLAWNAYSEPNATDWKDVPGWNVSAGFGWAEEGIRGYVFESWPVDGPSDKGRSVDGDPDLVAIVIKGTSPNAFGVGGPTSPGDKFNDNMMFSCCCGKVDRSWSSICPCYMGRVSGTP
ncbi:putative lipase atg15, partial [Gonapodya sp. JEL0774]